jgi:spermidine/putrescine-binding protein
MMGKRKRKKAFGQKVTRRDFMKVAGSAAVVTAASASVGPFIRTSKAAKLEIRWLGWEHYNVKKLTAEFEKINGCKVSAGFFDANSEAYNKLKAGGTKDFDLVMADGFWPRLYGEQGMTQPVDYGKLSNLKYCHSDFVPPKYVLLREEKGTNMIASPNCWGGYGFTVNTDKIPEEDANTIYLMYNEKYKGHLSTSGRHDENIALAGIYVCHHNGRTKEPNFNPYRLTDEELEEAKELLIKQKPLLVMRWHAVEDLERLMRAQVVWASPEWSGIFRRIYFDYQAGKTKLKMDHILQPKEGGLGWVDTWCITSGVTDSEKLELCHQWIDWRLKPENMAIIAHEIGWSPCIDVRPLIPEADTITLFQNETHKIHNLYQFDAPDRPEKWEEIWTAVEAA